MPKAMLRTTVSCSNPIYRSSYIPHVNVLKFLRHTSVRTFSVQCPIAPASRCLRQSRRAQCLLSRDYHCLQLIRSNSSAPQATRCFSTTLSRPYKTVQEARSRYRSGVRSFIHTVRALYDTPLPLPLDVFTFYASLTNFHSHFPPSQPSSSSPPE